MGCRHARMVLWPWFGSLVLIMVDGTSPHTNDVPGEHDEGDRPYEYGAADDVLELQDTDRPVERSSPWTKTQKRGD